MKFKPRFEQLLLPLLLINGILHTYEYNFKVFTQGRSIILIIAMLATLWALYFKNREMQIKVLIGFSFLGSEPFLFIIPILFIPLWLKALVNIRNTISIRKMSLIVGLFLTYCLMLIVVTNLLEPAIMNVALWFLISASWMLLFIYYSRQSYTHDEANTVFTFLKNIIIFQVPIMLLQALIHRDFYPGDSWTGGSGNSVLVGFYFCILLIFYFGPYFLTVAGRSGRIGFFKIRDLLLLLGFAVLLYLNDSKMLIMVFLAAGVLYFVFVLAIRFFTTFSVISLLRLTVVSSILVIVGFVMLGAVSLYGRILYKSENGLSSVLHNYIQPDLNPEGTNAKYILYKRIYYNLAKDNFLAWTFGLGPGRFGGKASNIMAYDILYKEEGQMKLPEAIRPYSSYYTKRYMGDLWTEAIAITSQWRSATLSFPFAGMATIKGEYGLVGVILFIFMTMSMSYFLMKKATSIDDRALRSWAIVLSIFWFSLPLHMIFDNFHEKLFIIFPMTLLSAVIYSLAEKKESPAPEPTVVS